MISFFCFQIDEVLEEGVGDLKDKIPILLVMNKKDLIKPGEIAKKLEVWQGDPSLFLFVLTLVYPFLFGR